MNNAIEQLVAYGLKKELIQPEDAVFVRNQLLMTMGLDEFVPCGSGEALPLPEILGILTENAVQRGTDCEPMRAPSRNDSFF